LHDAFQFLPAGGRMGTEIRAHDWSATSLGSPDLWPPALRVRLAQMLACPTAMFLAWGPDLLCFYNDAYRPILGYRQPNSLGRPFREVWASIWDEIEPLVQATLKGRSQTLTDVMLDLSREGKPERSWWSFTYSPALDDVGAINGLFCVTGETTDRVLGEAALRESEDHFRHTVELNPQVPWTCDPNGKITSYSNRWLELTGQGPGEPLGSGWVKVLHPDDVPWTLTKFTAALAAGEPVDVDYRIHMAATGDFRWMRARAFPRRDTSGAIVRWYGVVEDVHDRKLAEARLQEMNATLERRVEEALVQRKLWADVSETASR
jgi:PAS domain S-box-containing protein